MARLGVSTKSLTWRLRGGKIDVQKTAMSRPPYFALDLAAQGMLPNGWAEKVLEATSAPERIVVQTGVELQPGDEQFSILEGAAVRARLPWLWDLYLGPLRSFASDRFSMPLFVSNRISSAITLNILDGAGAGQAWHVDSNTATGVFFATGHEGEAGALEFQQPDGDIIRIHPRAGMFVCMAKPILHRVVPLDAPGMRLSLAMLYYDSPTDQPFANASDRHEMSPS